MMGSTGREHKEISKTVINLPFTGPEKSQPLLGRVIDK